MCVCYLVGRVVGALIQHLLDHQVAAFAAANPLPDMRDDDAGADATAPPATLGSIGPETTRDAA